MRSRYLPPVLATAALCVSCEREPATPPGPVVDFRDYLPAPGTSAADATVAFAVDSTVYDPAVGGTDVRTSAQTWTLSPVAVDGAVAGGATGDRLYLVSRRDSAGAQAGQGYWRWATTPEGDGLLHALDGITYLSLVSPLRVGTTWDPLVYTDAELVVPIEEEPVALHKDYGASVDSLGSYTLPTGDVVEAVWVTHARSENRIELRRVREVYGRGVGLLERRADVLDSQSLEALPWAEKAERGFSVVIRRLR